MTGMVVTFTNLFPSHAFPQHGTFVAERMRRVIVKSGLAWRVVCPVPQVPWLLRRGTYRRAATMPDRETISGALVMHPRYRHVHRH